MRNRALVERLYPTGDADALAVGPCTELAFNKYIHSLSSCHDSPLIYIPHFRALSFVLHTDHLGRSWWAVHILADNSGHDCQRNAVPHLNSLSATSQLPQ